VEYVILSLAVLLMLVGLAGAIIPLLPGTTLMFVVVLLQKWLLPETLPWVAVAWIGGFWLLSLVVDFGCAVLGARVFGGSKWGMAGASGGALVGMFFSLPALLLGTLLGATLAEKLGAKRSTGHSLRAGVGATAGFLFGTVVRFAFAVTMLAIYATALYFGLRGGAAS
jgi:uncharacterized protein